MREKIQQTNQSDAPLEHCIAYFKSRPALHQMMNLMKQKYQSLGHIGGSIVIAKPSKEEMHAIGQLLGIDVSSHKTLQISLKQLENALQETIFEGISLAVLLKGYFESDLMSHKDRRSGYEEQRLIFFQSLIDDCQDTIAFAWLQDAFETRNSTMSIWFKQYDSEEDNTHGITKLLFQQMAHAINQLPALSNQKVTLPVFATQITGNPHYFDDGSTANTLLLHAIKYYLKKDASASMNIEGRSEMLYQVGILKDDMSNFTMTCGLLALDEANMQHPGWNAFDARFEPLIVTLYHLNHVVRVMANKRVYIVENPSVFGALMDVSKEHQIQNVSFVCTNGQLNLSSLMLLDFLYQEDIAMYYAGDFDPEGLLIADKLLERYPGKMDLWCYDMEHYERCLSEQRISDKRLSSLKNIKSEQLKKIANWMIVDQRSGYQEALIAVYHESILANI